MVSMYRTHVQNSKLFKSKFNSYLLIILFENTIIKLNILYASLRKF